MSNMELFHGKDVEALEYAWKHPSVYRNMGDDYLPPSTKVDFAGFAQDEKVEVFIAKRAGRVGGAITFRYASDTCVVLHCGFIEGFRGAFAAAMLRAAITKMFELGVMKVTAQLPVDNVAAIRMAMACGAVKEGVNRASVYRGGLLTDQVYLGVTRDEWRW